MNISSHLPDLINNYISIRAQRLALDKEAASLKETEDELHKTIVEKFRAGGITAQGAGMGLLKMSEIVEPIAEDWIQVWGYIKEHDAWELVHKRITVTAVRERWENGIIIPGIGRMTKYKLSVSGTK
jgi:hypothetical protein